MNQTESLIKHALEERLSLVLVINKVDRLIVELKLPPDDAYLKLRHVISEVNSVIASSSHGLLNPPFVSPELGNVCFSSGLMGWSFTIESFARIYSDYFSKKKKFTTFFNLLFRII